MSSRVIDFRLLTCASTRTCFKVHILVDGKGTFVWKYGQNNAYIYNTVFRVGKHVLPARVVYLLIGAYSGPWENYDCCDLY